MSQFYIDITFYCLLHRPIWTILGVMKNLLLLSQRNFQYHRAIKKYDNENKLHKNQQSKLNDLVINLYCIIFRLSTKIIQFIFNRNRDFFYCKNIGELFQLLLMWLCSYVYVKSVSLHNEFHKKCFPMLCCSNSVVALQ